MWPKMLLASRLMVTWHSIFLSTIMKAVVNTMPCTQKTQLLQVQEDAGPYYGNMTNEMHGYMLGFPGYVNPT
jgi:hypothetical protein